MGSVPYYNLVEVTLNDQATLKLLIDTGASMTALTRESFRRLSRQRFSLLGTRLFNTANGYTRGDIYRASALTLGEARLEGANIAVLDLRTMDDIDGLLGMNVLRQFHFEIDQSAGVMLITRR
jgi:clan AA aspartic protease (TIGR02281 family)